MRLATAAGIMSLSSTPGRHQDVALWQAQAGQARRVTVTATEKGPITVPAESRKRARNLPRIEWCSAGAVKHAIYDILIILYNAEISVLYSLVNVSLSFAFKTYKRTQLNNLNCTTLTHPSINES